MPAIYHAFDQLANLMANLAPTALMELKASPEMEARYRQLMQIRDTGTLSREEKDELDHFIVLERLVRLAKIKADSL